MIFVRSWSVWLSIFFPDIINCDVDDGCHDNATCTDGDGSYTCVCNDGFTGDGFHCSDHCENNTCGDNQICNTLSDIYQCACNNTDEYLVNGSCTSRGSHIEITGLKLNKVYLSDYDDSSSMAYKDIAAEIESKVLAFLKSNNETSNSDIYGVKVISIKNGDLMIVNMTIASNLETLSTSLVQIIINGGIANGNFSSMAATGTVQAQGILHIFYRLSDNL